MLEPRLKNARDFAHLKPQDLPKDYLSLIEQSVKERFNEPLRKLSQSSGQECYFFACGKLYASEILLCVSILKRDQLPGTSFYASFEFDVLKSKENIDKYVPELMKSCEICLDAIEQCFESLFNSLEDHHLENILSPSLGDLTDVPFEWSNMRLGDYSVYVKIDKANPELEQKTEDWLEKNDLHLKDKALKDNQASEDLFITPSKVSSF